MAADPYDRLVAIIGGSMKLPGLSYANVASTLAIVLALSGTAYAAGLPRNSVGTNQLKAQAVTAAKLKPSAVGSKQLKNGGVTAGKIKPGAVGQTQLDPVLFGALSSAISAATPIFVNDSSSGIQQIQTGDTILASVEFATPGTYFVAVDLRVFPRASNPGSNLFCTFGDLSLTNVKLLGSGVTQVPLTGPTVVSSAGNLSLKCSTTSGEITASYDVSAVKVVPQN